jgi:hypothetical protein
VLVVTGSVNIGDNWATFDHYNTDKDLSSIVRPPPLSILNRFGNCIRTKSPFADWSSDNCNRQNKKSAPTVIIETQN